MHTHTSMKHSLYQSTADPQSSRTVTPIQVPQSSSRYYQPYFSHAEIEFLSEKQRGKQSATQEEKIRQAACTFIETIGARIGFPRRTIATAQALYHRFHLFFPRKDFQYYDAALAALFVSTKENDTLKKPRELLASSYTVRYPELAAKSKNPVGDIDLGYYGSTVEKHVIKFAWRISIDCYRTLLPLIYPPHSLAVGCIYVACILLCIDNLDLDKPDSEPKVPGISKPKTVAWQLLQNSFECQDTYRTHRTDCQEIAYAMLDLYTHFCQNQSTNTSPSTPSSPSPNLSVRDKSIWPSNRDMLPYNADTLLQVKIALRKYDEEQNLPVRKPKPLNKSDPATLSSGDKIGQNAGTVRFLFFPPGAIKENKGSEREKRRGSMT